MDTFELTIVEDEKIHFHGPASYCGITTPSGEIGFLPKHENFLGTISPGTEIRYNGTHGTGHTLTAAWGTLLFKDNACVITMAQIKPEKQA